MITVVHLFFPSFLHLNSQIKNILWFFQEQYFWNLSSDDFLQWDYLCFRCFSEQGSSIISNFFVFIFFYLIYIFIYRSYYKLFRQRIYWNLLRKMFPKPLLRIYLIPVQSRCRGLCRSAKRGKDDLFVFFKFIGWFEHIKSEGKLQKEF